MSPVHSSVREVAVLQQATQMILSSLDPDTVLHHMLLVVRNYFGASRCAVYLVDEASRELYCRAQNGYDAEASLRRLAIGKDSPAGWAAFTCAPLYIPDLSKEPRHDFPNQNVASVLALPLVVRERPLGVLEICSETVDAFDKDAISLLSLFADEAAIALENARLYSTDLRRMRQIEIINLIARSAAGATDTEQFFTMLVELISDTFEDAQIAIVLVKADGSIEVPAFAGVTQILMDRFNVARHHGVLAEALKRRSLAVVNDVGERPNWPTCFPGTGSELCVPLVSLGETLGAIVLGHGQAKHFSLDDRAIAQAAADVCATAARNVQLSEELRRVATIDPLTGVFNQRYFHTAVAAEIPRARRHKKEFGLVMLDLRGFRDVNLALGVQAGDALLKQVADTVKSELRNNDVICRYLGDRFALVLPEVNSDGVISVLGKLQHALRGVTIPYLQSPAAIRTTWATVLYPEHGTEEPDLVKNLLDRLAVAKQQTPGASAGA